MSDWISVKERLPEDWTPVLVLIDGAFEFIAQREGPAFDFPELVSEGDGYVRAWGLQGGNVTHWMPLPEPPNG